MQTTRDRFPHLASVVTWTVTVIIALSMPFAYFSINYSALVSALETKAQIKAEIINQLIAVSPEMWRYQEHRMNELLNRYPAELKEEQARILDEHGTVLTATENHVVWPMLTRSVGLFDSGVLIGHVEIRHSLRALLRKIIVAGLAGLLLAGTVFGLLRTMSTRLRHFIDALSEEKERAQVTLNSIGDAVVTTDTNENIDYLNPMAESLTGWKLAEALGRPLDEVLRTIDEETNKPAESLLRQAMRDNRIYSYDDHAAIIRRDESTVPIEQRAAPIHNRDGKVVGGVTILHDKSATRKMAQRITWAATHDALTSLANRREFEARVEAALDSARNSDKQHVLCYMDLDQFKVVNDTCGHAAGDALLMQIAVELESRIRKSDTLARLGGDEFGVLLDGCALDRAELITADLLSAVRDFRFSWDDKLTSISASIGMVAITADSVSRAEIFSAADAACYTAKEQGRNRVCVYRSTDMDMSKRRLEMSWVGRITRALEENRLTLYYQSYLPLARNGAEGKHIEILVRLIDEKGNIVMPGSFLPAAERYNIMPDIDRWVIKTAFSRYHDFASNFSTPLTFAINLSGTSFNTDGLLDFIREQAHTHTLPHGAICFEVTETAAIDNLQKVAKFMKDVKALGFSFALDDFGIGTSSFRYLRNLPVDYLKIDGSFVKNIVHDPLNKAMTETINRIGHIMGMKTVGEFAETEEVINELRSMGVDFAQGYGVEKPQPLP